MTKLPIDAIRLLYAYDSDAPLEGKTQVAEASGPVKVERFQFQSRHEQTVPGLILTDPENDAPRPLVLVAHPGTLDKSSDYVLWPAQQWVAAGAICATIDQAGHGERARSPVSMEDFSRYPFRRMDHTIQTAVDWMRALDYLSQRRDVDAERVAFVGFSMGGMRGAPFVSLDERVKSAVFCISGAARNLPDNPAERLAQEATDPATFAPLMTSETLVVAGRNDDLITPESAQGFHDAMPDPKSIVWLDCGHWDFMPQGVEPIWPFLESRL